MYIIIILTNNVDHNIHPKNLVVIVFVGKKELVGTKFFEHNDVIRLKLTKINYTNNNQVTR